MKKLLCAVLAVSVALFTFIPASFADGKTIMDTATFSRYYAAAIKTTQSGNIFTEDTIKWTVGAVNDVCQISVNDYCVVQLSLPTGTKDISEIVMIAAGDGSSESGLAMIYTIAEIAMITGAIDKTAEVSDFMDTIGMTSDRLVDGGSGEKTIGKIKYSWSMSSIIGLLFSASVA